VTRAADYWTTIVPTIPGWIEQWYTKLPAVANLTLAEPPGWMIGVAKLPLSARASCAATSLFVNVTVEPTATVTGLGAYAFVVRPKAPLTMLIAVVPVAGGVGVGVGVVGVVGVDELLHAARLKPANRTSAYRIDMRWDAAKPLPTAIRDFRPESNEETTKGFREPEWLSGRVTRLFITALSVRPSVSRVGLARRR
jgi:hypothetical protein